jgi:DNA invertase Pin-like site-specific DNA recombinase
MREPRRCAIYSRFSGDTQRASSVEDQQRECRLFAMRQGYEIAEKKVTATSVMRDLLLRFLEAEEAREGKGDKR